MLSGTSLLRGSHCGSNVTGDDCGIGGCLVLLYVRHHL
jgi:hypothetical protein